MSELALLRAVPLVAALTLTQAHGHPSLEGTAMSRPDPAEEA